MKTILRPIRRIPVSLLCTLAVVFLMGCPAHIWTPKPPYGATTGTNDFDLTSKQNDGNGSPDDPRWAPQDQNAQHLPPTEDSNCKKSGAQPYEAGCTDQGKFLVKDTGSGINGLLCSLFGAGSSSITGHVDWTAASARGPIGWLNFAEDFDYNLLLLPDQEYGLTENNNERPDNGGRYMEIEFDSREFDGRFGTKWWKEFARLAEEGAQARDFTKIQDYLHAGDGLAYGVVYGILGIDCEHGCRSEIHPAYAVAIQVSEGKDSNKWAIFARNWGDEGFCSHFDHQLDLSTTQNALHLMLPYSSPSGPKINKDDYEVATWSSDSSQCPTYGFVKDQGEEITIPLPPPGQQRMAEVIVDFQWPDGASAVKYKQVDKNEIKKLLAMRSSAAEKPRAGESVEEQLGRLSRELNQGKRFPEGGFQEGILKQFSATRPAAKQTARSLKNFENRNVATACQAPEAANPAVTAKAMAAPSKPKLPKMENHAAKEFWDQALVHDLCAAYEKAGRKLPDGESADMKAKLDKVCSDKRVRP